MTPFRQATPCFAAGALAATGAFRLDLLLAVMAVAAVAGNVVNYAIGRRRAPVLRRRAHTDDHRSLREARARRKAHAFFVTTAWQGRRPPPLRAHRPDVPALSWRSGAQMPYQSFMFYNVTGCVLWVGICVGAGYLFGNIPIVKENWSSSWASSACRCCPSC
ncbi:MAG: hypothetical protein R2712_31945 [Vicinamibacterales bacterium]